MLVRSIDELETIVCCLAKVICIFCQFIKLGSINILTDCVTWRSIEVNNSSHQQFSAT